jgi:antitoxin VapB
MSTVEVGDERGCAGDWAWLDAIAGKLDDDFVEAVQEEVAQQERPALDKLFP